tara:strand:- start:468 stop:677 length:210 start_codon:yes stop_codon:yes gene_type:complete
MAKKVAAKKAEPKKDKEAERLSKRAAEAQELIKVSRFHKDGNRYEIEIPKSELLYHQNGDDGLADIIIG